VELRQFINLSLLSGSIGRFRDWQDSSGVFADARIALTSRATITVGMRYQRDRQKRVGALTANSFEIPVDFIGKFHAWLPKVTAAYDVTPDVRIGAMVQKAYNPGGTTIRVDTGRPDEFKTETLWDYELFARSRFADGRATASVNLFAYDMRNAQRAEDILVFTPSGRRAGFANLFNVPKARSYGAEAELDWHASDTLSAKVAVGLLDTKMIRVDAESAHLQGNEFDRSPRFTGSAAIDWRPTERLRLSAQLRHHSPYFSDPENTPKFRVDSGTNLDARAEYRLKRFVVFAQVRNMFDTFNLLDLGVPDPLTGAPQAGEAEDPRMVAVGLETRF
jgi:iron complex outermembrane recepter protein